MNETELMIDIIKEIAPEECKSIGVTNLMDIVRTRGKVKLISVAGESEIDLQTALSIVASLTAIVSAGVKIYKNSFEKKTDLEPKQLQEILFNGKIADQDNLKQHIEKINSLEEIEQEKISIVIFSKIEITRSRIKNTSSQ